MKWYNNCKAIKNIVAKIDKFKDFEETVSEETNKAVELVHRSA